VCGFTIVSLAGFAPWAFAGRALHRVVGEVGLYVACAAVFILLSGVFLHRLIIGPGSLARFYVLFTAAFMAYAVCWTVGWMSLRGNLGSIVGLFLGASAMAAILVWAFGAREAFLQVATALFVLNAIGYFAGGWAEAEIVRLKTIHALGAILSAHTTRIAAMLAWGACYGIGLGAALGVAFYACQTRARALLTGQS
jgi:hypothetical protein